MPTRAMTHVDSILTNISVAYIQDADAFIADKVFPVVPVQKQSDRYFMYLKEDWFRDEAEERAPATESAGGDYEIDNTPTYFCRKYAFHKDVTEEDRANSDTPLNADTDATEYVTQKMLLRREVVWATKYFTVGGTAGARTSSWGTTMSGVAAGPSAVQFVKWDVSGSTPIEDVSAGKMAMAAVTGYKPNVLVLGAEVYEKLRNHDDILGRIVFTQRGYVTTEILAQLFDVPKVVVSWAVKNSAKKLPGTPTTTGIDFLMGKHALLMYVAPRPALKMPSAGYIFAWTGLLGAAAYGNRMSRIAAPLLGQGTERIEGEMAFDCQIVASDLGYMFADCVS